MEIEMDEEKAQRFVDTFGKMLRLGVEGSKEEQMPGSVSSMDIMDYRAYANRRLDSEEIKTSELIDKLKKAKEYLEFVIDNLEKLEKED